MVARLAYVAKVLDVHVYPRASDAPVHQAPEQHVREPVRAIWIVVERLAAGIEHFEANPRRANLAQQVERRRMPRVERRLAAAGSLGRRLGGPEVHVREDDVEAFHMAARDQLCSARS